MILNTKNHNLVETSIYLNWSYPKRLCEVIWKKNDKELKLILNKENTKFEYFTYWRNDIFNVWNISDEELRDELLKLLKEKDEVSFDDVYKIARWKWIFYQDIPQISSAHYNINVWLEELPLTINSYKKWYNLNMSPEYQRWYVWTEDQKIKYVEYFLKWWRSWRDIFLNCPKWQRSGTEEKMEVVDWKQRLTALLEYLDNKFPAFWHYHKEYSGFMQCPALNIHINDLENPKDIVQWYLDMNTGGAIHTEEDLKSAYEYQKSL